MSASQLFAATTLADAATAYDALLTAEEDTTGEVQYVLDAWEDQQAVANVLMHPDLIAPPLRVPTLVRGLEEEGYLQVAAAVGAGRLPAPVAEEDRVALVDALLDLLAGQGGLAAVHAAEALATTVQADDAVEIVVLLGHPDDDVRLRLQAITLRLLGAAGLDRLLDDRDLVQVDDAELAREQLAEDGVDLAGGATVRPPTAPPVPNLQDYDGS